ncbi:type II toxin-antitoxin system VapC family toxin [Nostoc sp. C052]|uniref:PIN domain-containing protein n=1 Tax=Nostoc sp. C052 TaxID=2576902 RepID=UPI0015C3F9E4|nr:PIN domain-containing protein [Nostoc sp. C052]QLE40566.1 type II toxin-antitoxin system VapC family toxin [Nostoc sp. C052]
MSGRYLLDTNIIIALFANDIAVDNQLVNAEEIFIPSVAIGELFYGARKSGRTCFGSFISWKSLTVIRSRR